MEDTGLTIVGIIVCILLFFGGRAVYRHFFGHDYSKTWWSGTQNLKVCKVGTTNCYTLPVTSEDGVITQVSFPNGGYLVANSTDCAEAASFYDFDYFCRFTDQEGRNWEVMPY